MLRPAHNPAVSGSLLGELCVLVIKDSESSDTDVCSMLFVIDRPLTPGDKLEVTRAMKKAMGDDWQFSDVELAIRSRLSELGYMLYDAVYHDIWLQDVMENPAIDTSLSPFYVVVREKDELDEHGTVQTVLEFDRQLGRELLMEVLIEMRRETDDDWDYMDLETLMLQNFPGARVVEWVEWIKDDTPEDLEIAWCRLPNKFFVSPGDPHNVLFLGPSKRLGRPPSLPGAHVRGTPGPAHRPRLVPPRIGWKGRKN